LINGFSFEEIRALFLAKTETNWLPKMIPFEEINQKYGLLAEIFTCAASRLVTQSQIDSLIANGLEVISCGANVPLLIKKFSLDQ
jgi:hypothetical protein